mgnify:CR=1 FL=1
MIYTVTFNPAIDYVVRLDRPLEVGEVNRAAGEDCVLGGKGINVSGVLRELGCKSVALGFVAGETGAWLERGLAAQGLRTDFIHLAEGMTRINVKIKAGTETELNGAGPSIPESAMQQLEAQLDTLQPDDILILAGSIPKSLSQSTYERLLAGLEGHGVSYCAICDAFFYRGRDVAVLGSGEYALHEVQALLPVAHSVTLLTGGAPLTAQFPPEVAVRTEAVEAILGEERVTGVQLKDGGTLEVSGVFVALGVAGSTALARKLGAEVNGSRIVVDDHMQTSLPGLYAAGDCTGGLLQVAKAVYEGAVAGTEAAKALRK